jgi:hypothetical protein
MPHPLSFSTDRDAQRQMALDFEMLCRSIGERRAGTGSERVAARYIQQEFARAGLSGAQLEDFPCLSRRGEAVEVAIREGREWRAVAASALVGAPGTPDGRAIEGELVWLEMPEESARLLPRSLRGKVLALFGPLPTSAALHRQLVAAQPAAVIHLDERLPFDWVKNDGVYPYWARQYGVPPTVTVPYREAWRWRQAGLSRVRVRVAVKQVAAESANVIAELPGREPALPALVLGAHHDTQCNNVGADDNASGVVALLALARAMKGRARRRTVRFVSFGTEEQLSVGSVAHVKARRITPDKVGLVVNFDSVASPLGHHQLWVAGDARLEAVAVRRLAARGLGVQARRELTPFADQFPFNRAGVPSLCFMRPNFAGGRWQHHSVHDNLDNISLPVLSRLLDAAGPLIDTLAQEAKWGFGTRLPVPVHAEAKKIGRELFG